jgi:hypothetical protein
MLEQDEKNWKELCCATLEAKDPGRLLDIVQRLNNALEREEQVNRDPQIPSHGVTSEEAQC